MLILFLIYLCTKLAADKDKECPSQNFCFVIFHKNKLGEREKEEKRNEHPYFWNELTFLVKIEDKLSGWNNF